MYIFSCIFDVIYFDVIYSIYMLNLLIKFAAYMYPSYTILGD